MDYGDYNRFARGKDRRQMSFAWRFLPAATTLVILSASAFSQETTLQNWLTVPPGEADLVLLIDGHFTSINISTEYPPNPPKVYASWSWSPKFPAFVVKFRVKTREYQFGLQGPISSISVIPAADAQTFLHLSPLGQEKSVGAAVSVTQGAAGNILAILNDLEQSGYDFKETQTPLSGAGKILIDTTRPWPIPPPKK
jgi:hypothetical protein